MKKRNLLLRFVLSLVILLSLTGTVFAAQLAQLKAVRWNSDQDNDRIVFELSQAADHKVTEENNGQRIVIELMGTTDRAKGKPAVKSSQVKGIKYDTTLGNKIKIIIDLTDPAEYTVNTLKNPQRLYLDIAKNYERIKKIIVADGITHITYNRRTIDGPLSAHFLAVDNKKYNIRPALAGGIVKGRQTTAKIAADNKAVAAINASYFGNDGTILGYLRIDGTTAGTTCFTRSALGIRADGAAFVDKLAYNCAVTIGKTTLFASGVNAERGENGLVIYNRYYDKKTGTNEFGKEYLIRGNIVSLFKGNNSDIPADGYIISVHGTAKNTFRNVKVGDKVVINENLGPIWNGVPQVIGAGPMLLKNGQVKVTALEEEFPDDIAVGRAPRTGFGIMPDGQYLLGIVDGRQSFSIGCTLTEWAELLKKMGAREAINFDGGGSTEMVLRNRVVNSPSDGKERPVGSALVVLSKK